MTPEIFKRKIQPYSTWRHSGSDVNFGYYIGKRFVARLYSWGTFSDISIFYNGHEYNRSFPDKAYSRRYLVTLAKRMFAEILEVTE